MNRRTTALLIALLLVAWALRICRLGYQELRGDEAFGVLFATQGVREIVSETIRLAEPHPPLDYVLLNGWMALAGDSEFAARFPSAVAGTLAVALAFALARRMCEGTRRMCEGAREYSQGTRRMCERTRRMFGTTAALWASAFLALNPYHIWHAQEARMYAISAALALASMLALWVALERGKWQTWVAFVLLTVAHLYLHYYSFFIVLAQIVFVLVQVRRYRQRLWGFVAAMVAVGLLYLPWLVTAWDVLFTYRGNGDSPTLPAMTYRVLRAVSLGETIEPTVAMPFLVAFGLLAVVGVWHAARTKARGALLLGLWLILPLAGVWVASLQRPVFNERYIIAATPPFYLFLGCGTAWLARQRRWGKVVLGLLVVACLAGTIVSLRNHYTQPEYSKTAGWRQVVEHLEREATQGDALVQNLPDPVLSYYYRGPLPLYVLPKRAHAPAERTGRALEELLEQYDRLWVLPYPSPLWDGTGEVAKWLELNADRVKDTWLGRIHLQAYEAWAETSDEMIPVNARLGPAIALLGYRLTGTAQAGSPLSLTLYWQAGDSVQGDYTVFTHVIDANELTWGQKDNPPVSGTYPTSRWQVEETIVDRYEIDLDPETPPGEYRLVVGMYDPNTSTRLAATAEPGRVLEGDRVLLTVLHVDE